ncbi:D-2-hydroxyacid dehydrogenase family protein [Paenibacillus campi]|uniref:D-2-hydroxyacid dehydrogenase family protein n=1 Tax=Paenibacillus campi TaxID=3106031 RepID=UPI002B003536|nr:D-2-hydroxyacid dehydrogenase family protein [Paenibacillus sp. SGZ-1014]
MTMWCAVLDDYQQVALRMADWSVLDGQVHVRICSHPIDSADELVNEVKDCEILVIMRERTPFPADVLERLPNLRLLVTTGMRNAAVDMAAAQRLGITVCGARGRGAAPTELTWALILGLTRHLVAENEAFRSGGPWQTTIGTGLYGKTLGLIGLGQIGTRMARIAQAMDMDVIAWSPNLTVERAQKANVRQAATLTELLNQSDIVSVHMVLSESTRHLLGATELAHMRQSAYLINTSRAGLIDQQALIDVLQHYRIAGAGLDVFEQEPLPLHHPLRTLPNVLATPHIGYVADDNYRSFYEDAVDDIVQFLQGEPVRVLGK